MIVVLFLFCSCLISQKLFLDSLQTQFDMSSCLSFPMPSGGWMKWSAKSKLAQDLEAMMCSGLLDGKFALDIQLSYPAYQIFNLANFLNNVPHLQYKLGLEFMATVSFASTTSSSTYSFSFSTAIIHPTSSMLS